MSRYWILVSACPPSASPSAEFPILRNSGVRIPDFGNRKPELGSGRGCWIRQVIALSYLSSIRHPASFRLKQWDYDSPQLVGLRQSFAKNWHTTSVLDLRSPNNTGHLFLFFFFQFSFFLWIKLGLFLLFLFAFVFFPFITHISFSLFESELCRTVAAKPCVRS